jgi:membrane protein DedA with SNARE-associated domain
MNRLPDLLLYLALSVGAGLENFVPAIPADTFVALGGFLAGAGDLQAHWAVLGTWIGNVAGALFVYRLSHRHGQAFFERGLGRHLLRPHQMQRMSRFYARWGTPAIFFSRFLPGVRAIVPVFAGVTHQSWATVVAPIMLASALWYGALVQIGLLAGQNLSTLSRMLGRLNTMLAVPAVLVALVIGIWWFRTRRAPDE